MSEASRDASFCESEKPAEKVTADEWLVPSISRLTQHNVYTSLRSAEQSFFHPPTLKLITVVEVAKLAISDGGFFFYLRLLSDGICIRLDRWPHHFWNVRLYGLFSSLKSGFLRVCLLRANGVAAWSLSVKWTFCPFLFCWVQFSPQLQQKLFVCLFSLYQNISFCFDFANWTGEQPAAMQHGKNGSGGVVQSASWWNTAFVTLLLMTLATKAMSTWTIASQGDEQVGSNSGGNSTPNLSTDWTVSPISIGCKTRLATLDDGDVPPRCWMMTTHSARSSWLLPPRPQRVGVRASPVCKYMNNVVVDRRRRTRRGTFERKKKKDLAVQRWTLLAI